MIHLNIVLRLKRARTVCIKCLRIVEIYLKSIEHRQMYKKHITLIYPEQINFTFFYFLRSNI